MKLAVIVDHKDFLRKNSKYLEKPDQPHGSRAARFRAAKGKPLVRIGIILAALLLLVVAGRGRSAPADPGKWELPACL